MRGRRGGTESNDFRPDGADLGGQHSKGTPKTSAAERHPKAKISQGVVAEDAGRVGRCSDRRAVRPRSGTGLAAEAQVDSRWLVALKDLTEFADRLHKGP